MFFMYVFKMFLIKVKKHVFYVFYLKINVFNTYGVNVDLPTFPISLCKLNLAYEAYHTRFLERNPTKKVPWLNHSFLGTVQPCYGKTVWLTMVDHS